MNASCVAHEALHYFSECTHLPKATQRQAFWDGIQTQDQTLLDYMKPIQALRIATAHQTKQPRNQRVPH